MNTTDLYSTLYNRLLEPPLGTYGATLILPALQDLLREARTEKFWEAQRPSGLPEEKMLRIWNTYKRDLRELRERIRNQKQGDDLLSWLVMFVIENHRELARTSALYEPKYQLAFDMSWLHITPEEALACRDDWQAWVADWLRDALRDESLGATSSATGDGHDGTSGDNSDSGPVLQPKPHTDPDNVGGIDF